jgi:hypothetical protein
MDSGCSRIRSMLQHRQNRMGPASSVLDGFQSLVPIRGVAFQATSRMTTSSSCLQHGMRRRAVQSSSVSRRWGQSVGSPSKATSRVGRQAFLACNIECVGELCGPRRPPVAGAIPSSLDWSPGRRPYGSECKLFCNTGRVCGPRPRRLSITGANHSSFDWSPGRRPYGRSLIFVTTLRASEHLLRHLETHFLHRVHLVASLAE